MNVKAATVHPAVRLNDPSLLRNQCYVGGNWVDASDGNQTIIANAQMIDSWQGLVGNPRIGEVLDAYGEALEAVASCETSVEDALASAQTRAEDALGR